ncbi:MAG: hypothetical protein H7Y36_01825 [Armatimonadetes bacterium]|nr:hypothetical protein [Akkermansiaceae bacterium]
MTEASDKSRRIPPWKAGLQAAKANAFPGLVVQGMMLALLLGYYFYPPTTHFLNQLASLKDRWSYGYSAIASIIAGALIPEIMRILFFQKCRLALKNFKNLLFTIPFWCAMGVIVDFFYRQQADWFGTQITFRIVTTKVLVDQFLYNPLFAAPVGAWLYDWKNSGYRLRGTSRFFTATYYRDVVVPILFATWGVWLPIVSILYSLPGRLQIPLFALALTFWVILYTWIGEQRSEKS